MLTESLSLFLAEHPTGSALCTKYSPAGPNRYRSLFAAADNNNNNAADPSVTAAIVPHEAGDVAMKTGADRRGVEILRVRATEVEHKKKTAPHPPPARTTKGRGNLSPCLKRTPPIKGGVTRAASKQRDAGAVARSVSCARAPRRPEVSSGGGLKKAQPQRQRVGVLQKTTVTTKTRTATRSPAREGSKKSFIDSLTLGDSDSWRSPLSNAVSMARTTPTKKKSTEVRVVVGGNEMPTLEPLPRHTLCKLYAEDLGVFQEKNAAPVVTPLSSGPLGGDPLGPPAVSRSHAECDADVLPRGRKVVAKKAMGVHSRNAWNEPPANVLLPNGTIQQKGRQQATDSGLRDVWHARSHFGETEDETSEWMRPLQCIGRAERQIDSVTLSGMTRCLGTIHDDDYHGIFYGVHYDHRRRSHSVMDISNESTQGEGLSAKQGFTNSLAACSALLQEPQRLLDSEFLVPLGLPSSSVRKANPPVTMSFSGASEVLLSPLVAQPSQLVELSYSAKVLYTAVLYLRVLGGFPTLLRISPLQAECGVVGKEHCVELVFSSSASNHADSNTASSRPMSDTHPPSYRGVMSTFMTNWNNADNTKRNMKTEERSVVVRSVLAEKSVVKRFGRREVVHVLPPLEGHMMADDDNTGGGRKGQELVSKSGAVYDLLHGTESKSRASRTGLFQYGNADGSRGAKRSQTNCGDIVVAFLMSAEASKFSGLLPEPMDLEGLRYKIYGLREGELHDPTSVAKRNVALETPAATTTASFADSFCVAGGREERRQRFPPYKPVTVSESTLEAMRTDAGAVRGDGGSQGEIQLPYFHQLRLPRFCMDLADAIQHAFDVQEGPAGKDAVRSHIF